MERRAAWCTLDCVKVMNRRLKELGAYCIFCDRWNNIPHFTQTEKCGRGPCEPCALERSTWEELTNITLSLLTEINLSS